MPMDWPRAGRRSRRRWRWPAPISRGTPESSRPPAPPSSRRPRCGPARDLEREAEVKRVALSDARLRPMLHAFFDASSEELRLWVLERARETAPDDGVVNYLLGRRLLAVGLPAAAAEALERALSATLPEQVNREAWRLLVSAHYRAGDCAAVRSDLGRMPDLSDALRAEVTEWQARCAFEERAFNGPLVPSGPFR